MTKNKMINERQQLYKKYRLAGMTRYESAVKAGYTHRTALSVIGSSGLKAIENGSMYEVFLKKGITDEVLADHAIAGLTANRIVVSEDGSKKWEFPDWNIRQKYLKTICELTGRMNVDINTPGGKKGIFDGAKIMVVLAPHTGSNPSGEQKIIDIGLNNPPT